MHHSVDRKEIAFVAAGNKAFLDAVTRARPQVLEPIVDLSAREVQQKLVEAYKPNQEEE